MKLTSKTKPEKILKIFREASDNDQINFEMPWGHIYLAGGILSKLQDNEHFIAHNGKWVGV